MSKYEVDKAFHERLLTEKGITDMAEFYINNLEALSNVNEAIVRLVGFIREVRQARNVECMHLGERAQGALGVSKVADKILLDQIVAVLRSLVDPPATDDATHVWNRSPIFNQYHAALLKITCEQIAEMPEDEALPARKAIAKITGKSERHVSRVVDAIQMARIEKKSKGSK